MADLSPLSGVEGKLDFEDVRAAVDPKQISGLRHPGHAHALVTSFAPGKVVRIITQCVGAVAANSEVWIKRQSGLRDNSRLI